MVEDMITLLEGAVQPELRKGKYPDRKTARGSPRWCGPSRPSWIPRAAEHRLFDGA